MEKGPSAKPRVNDSDNDKNDNNNDEGLDVENDKEEDKDLYEEFKNGGSNMRHMSFFFFFFRVFMFGCWESFEKIREKLYFRV